MPPHPQRVCTDSQEAQIARINEVCARQGLLTRGRVGASATDAGDTQKPISSPVSDWPAYDIFFDGGAYFQWSEFENVHPNHSSTRVENVGPASVALVVAGAVIVPQHAFRMMGANGDMDRPLGSTKFEARILPARRIHRGQSHESRTGVRGGPTRVGRGPISPTQ